MKYLVLLVLIVSACATPPKPSGKTPEKLANAFPSHFEVRGKIGVTDGKRGATLNLRWQQKGNNYTVYLSGPLGGQSAKIEKTDKLITLTHSDGRHVQTSNPEKLLAEQYGWQIPISGLHHWLYGKPEPQQPIMTIERDELSRIRQLTQNDWHIHYREYQTTQGFDVPYKINLSYEAIRLYVVLQNWKLNLP